MKTAAEEEGRATVEESIPETIVHAVKGEDAPMEESHPNASIGLVALSYPFALLIVLLGAFVAYWFL